MRRTILASCMAAMALSTIGCSSIGTLEHTSITQVDQANFRVVRTNVRGESYGFELLGFIPLVPATHADAMAALHESSQMEGGPYAMMNVTVDRSLLYLILFSMPRVTITADIIEYTD